MDVEIESRTVGRNASCRIQGKLVCLGLLFLYEYPSFSISISFSFEKSLLWSISVFSFDWMGASLRACLGCWRAREGPPEAQDRIDIRDL